MHRKNNYAIMITGGVYMIGYPKYKCHIFFSSYIGKRPFDDQKKKISLFLHLDSSPLIDSSALQIEQVPTFDVTRTLQSTDEMSMN